VIRAAFGAKHEPSVTFQPLKFILDRAAVMVVYDPVTYFIANVIDLMQQ
jgi:hypothetical protein